MNELLAVLSNIAIQIAIYLPAALALALLIGQGGMFAVGHNAFCCVGAYVYAMLIICLGFPAAAAVISSVAFSLCIGYMTAFLARRLRGDEFALGSLLFLAALYGIAYNWTPVTRGASGVPSILPGGGTNQSALVGFSLIALICAWAAYFLTSRLVQSAFGRSLRALREDEIAAQAAGRATSKVRGHVFAIAAALAGLSGSLYAGYVGYIDPTVFYLDQAIILLAMALLGGSRSGAGTLLGVTTVVVVLEVVRFLRLPPEVAQLAFGLSLILLARFRAAGFATTGHA